MKTRSALSAQGGMNRIRQAICGSALVAFLFQASDADTKPTDPIPLNFCTLVSTVSCGAANCPVYLSNECGFCITVEVDSPVTLAGRSVKEAILPPYGDVTLSTAGTEKGDIKIGRLRACATGGLEFETRRRALDELRTTNELNGPFRMFRPMRPEELQGSRIGEKQVNFTNSWQVRRSRFQFRYRRRVWTKRELPAQPGSVTESEDVSEFVMTAYLQQLDPSILIQSGELTAKESGLDVDVPGNRLTVHCKKRGCLKVESVSPNKMKGEVDVVSFFVQDLNRARAAKGALRELILMEDQGLGGE